ncbi:Uncharacterised protein [Vibrio cholerae]|nr:Uncharacterised protein [Vibrio cholerae]
MAKPLKARLAMITAPQPHLISWVVSMWIAQ